MNRGPITICVVLATLMQALDTTIANVALPYMQGSLAASQDEIDWVLTSYIVAAAIMTPPTGYLAQKFGIKRLFLASVFGFTAASMLCGLAQTLPQIVVFRVLQGVFGASLVPLSQTVLLNINTKEQQGRAVALWGVAVMAGPVLGPVLGGWLTANYTWRYVFYINLPLGILTFIGMMTFLTETPKSIMQRFDWFGFASLSLAIGALQLCLDRGEELDWFGSKEIVIEAIIAGVSLYLFLIHISTTRAPFVKPALFRNRNFAAGVVFVQILGITYYSSLALQPPYLQDLLGYPIVTAGLVMGPRGVGTMAAMLLVGRLIGRVETRTLLAIGLGLSAWSFYEMTGWTPDVGRTTIVMIGVVQGVGLGFIFIPLTTISLSTLSMTDRAEGAGLYSLSRNIGSSVGISIMNSLLSHDTQVNHAEIARSVTAFNLGLRLPSVARFWSPFSAKGAAAINEIVNQQAQVIAYIDDYKLLMILTLAAIPLLVIFQRPGRQVSAEPSVASE